MPEIASRKHIEKINQVIEEALSQAGVGLEELDAVGVTYGPGLVRRSWWEYLRQRLSAMPGGFRLLECTILRGIFQRIILSILIWSRLLRVWWFPEDIRIWWW